MSDAAGGPGQSGLARIGARLSDDQASWWGAIAIAATNIIPLVGVLQGVVGAGDVFVLFWLENVVVGMYAIVRILTAQGVEAADGERSGFGPAASAAFFCFHYGIFAVVHGVFTLFLVFMSGGFEAGSRYWLVAIAGILIGHTIALVVTWFGGQRTKVSPSQAMSAPYPRLFVLHGSIIGGFFLMTNIGDGSPVVAVALLCVLKAVMDLWLARRGEFVVELS